MKRKLIAALVALSLPAVAFAHDVKVSDNTNVKLFGEVAGQHVTQNQNANGDDSYARLGVKLTHDVNDDLQGYGVLLGEYKFGTNGKDNNQVWAREGYVGLRYASDYSFQYGRFDGVMKHARALTDVLPAAGSDGFYFGDDHYLNGLASNVAQFRVDNVLVNDLSVTFQYQAKDENGDTVSTDEKFNDEKWEMETVYSYKPHKSSHGEGYGVSTQYDYGFGKFAVAYSNHANSEVRVWEGYEKSGKPDSHAEAFAVSASVDLSKYATLSALYLQTRNQGHIGADLGKLGSVSLPVKKTEGFELALVGHTDFGLTPAIGYNVVRGTVDNAVLTHVLSSNNIAGEVKRDESRKLKEYVSIGAKYAFTDNLSASASYNINLLGGQDAFYNAAGINDSDWVKVGLAYTF